MSNKIDTGLDNKRVIINIFFSVVVFGVNMFISFFITPYITSNLGSDAYGFVKLANDFTNYASLFSLALNSMASRFIMLKREQHDLENARKYYSSITIANIILAAFMMIPSIICVTLLDSFLDIPLHMLFEVRLTFALTFANFLISLAFSTFGNCYYLTNRLDINSLLTAVTNILKVAAIIGLFFIFGPKISFMGWGALLCSAIYIQCNIYFHKKLTPDLGIKIRYFDLRKIREVLSSGIWNSITKLSQIFSSGLDLLVTNIFLGAQDMGYLSLAKTVPNMMVSLNSTIANAFSPNMMMLYAKGDMERLKRATKSSMKFMCLFVTIPNAILVTMGTEFFTLWVPDQPARLINILSILTVINSCITGPLQPLYQIFTITNKIRQSSIVTIIYGFSSIVVTFVCLNTTGLGLYAVAGVSLIGSLIVALGYHLPFSAIYLGMPWYTFFPEIGKSIISFLVQCLIGTGVNVFLNLESSWVVWFSGAILSALIGLLINIILILNKEERTVLFGKFLKKFKRI